MGNELLKFTVATYKLHIILLQVFYDAHKVNGGLIVHVFLYFLEAHLEVLLVLCLLLEFLHLLFDEFGSFLRLTETDQSKANQCKPTLVSP